MARLRMDNHAQWEIQEFARAMYELVKPHFPMACEAFEDYAVDAIKISKQETLLLKRIMKSSWEDVLDGFRSEDGICKEYGLSTRELEDFKKNWL